jgi:hypothetical protein
VGIVTGAAGAAVAAVLAVAAVAKLRNVPAARETARALLVPAALDRPAVIGVVVAEGAAAALLLAPGTRRIGAALALLLLLAVTVLALVAVATGRHPRCACFGQRTPTPIGWTAFARNAVVIALASVAALPPWEGEPAPVGRVAGTAALAAVGLLLVIGVAFSVWAILRLMSQQGRLLLRIEALERPTSGGVVELPAVLAEARRAPEFELPDIAGRRRVFSQLLHNAGRPLLLLFSDDDCETCRQLLPALVAAEQENTLGVALTVISRQRPARGSADLFDAAGVVADRYGITGVPSGVLVDPAGLLHYETAAGPQAITALLRAHGATFTNASPRSGYRSRSQASPTKTAHALPVRMGGLGDSHER